MQSVVLDSFAILAWLQDEPCAEQVEDSLTKASLGQAQVLVSSINLGEVY
jgi:ribonuclease VapC